MVSAKNLVSNLFHSSVLIGDVIINSKELCLDHLNYKFIGSLERTNPISYFDYTISISGHPYTKTNFGYFDSEDYAHFAKPILLGLGKREGLIIETHSKGWINAPNKRKSLMDLKLKKMKLHGYGELWKKSETKSQLEESIRKELKIPRWHVLKKLEEAEMIKALEKIF